MEAVLQPKNSSLAQRRLVLGGLGGMGKTQLAVAFGTRHYQDDSSVFWLDASSEDAVKDSFRILAETVFDARDPVVLANERCIVHMKRWLSDRRNTRWLLIFDNYDDPKSYRVEQYYPDVLHGSIIVTTRRPELVAGHPIRLRPLQRVEEQLEVLETRSERKNVKFGKLFDSFMSQYTDSPEDLHARRLVERLGGLPLALATAGAYLRRSTFSFERYLQKYEQTWNVDHHWPAKLPEYERTLYTTWEVSYKSLERENHSAARLLGLLAYFSSRRFWYELFQAGVSEGLPEWLYGVISSDIAFESAMRTLTDYCFLEVQVSSSSWSMHMCVHDWTIATLDHDHATIKTQYWYAFDCIGALAEEEDWNSLANVGLSDLAAHARRLEHVCRDHSEAIEHVIPRRINRTEYIARLLLQQVQLPEAERMFVRALGGYEAALGPVHTSTLLIVGNLGLLYRDQGNLAKAEEMFVRAREGYEAALGPEHTSTLLTVNNLGLLYRDQGNLAKAEEMFLRAREGYESA